jgi:hypothetical protein
MAPIVPQPEKPVHETCGKLPEESWTKSIESETLPSLPFRREIVWNG